LRRRRRGRHLHPPGQQHDLGRPFEPARARGVFNPSSDSGDDSYETQLARFRATARERSVRLIEGGDAAIEAQLRMLLQNHVWIVPDDRTVAVTLTREKVAIVVTPRASEPA
jgi:hypothetical protein